MKQRYPRLHRHLAARLDPEHALGLHLTVGVLLLAAFAWLFGLIASDVVAHARITRVDLRLANWFHQFADSPWTPFVRAFTDWHHPIGIGLMAAVLGAWWYRRQERYWLLALLCAVPGGLILNVLLKYIFQRARPHFDAPLVSLASFSFPSGHTSGATVLYGMLAAWLVCHCRAKALQALIVAAALWMIALVALSRVYLGAHYLSDVLAGMAVGGAWLAVCITSVSTLRRQREARTLY
ncbi:MAG TPA: phosphatase PAP2 family protein [Telluria sp.]|jgi:undecaprenyl-diphosphatase|nr:phosphatase PAP2 family protein [Telluria sp.]